MVGKLDGRMTVVDCKKCKNCIVASINFLLWKVIVQKLCRVIIIKGENEVFKKMMQGKNTLRGVTTIKKRSESCRTNQHQKIEKRKR
jgi:hypothetical protein